MFYCLFRVNNLNRGTFIRFTFPKTTKLDPVFCLSAPVFCQFRELEPRKESSAQNWNS